MKILSKLMIGLFAVSMIVTSCDETEDDTDTNENEVIELPTNEDEAFDLVTKKWDLTATDEYNSMELTKDTLYIIDKVTALKSTDSISDIITGKFEISEDGTTITLIDFGTMILEQVNDSSIVVSISLTDGTDLGDVTFEEQEVVSSSEKTGLLCKTWLWSGDDESDYSVWIFSNSGTFVYKNIDSIYTSNWEWTDEDNSEFKVSAYVEEGIDNFIIESLNDDELIITSSQDSAKTFSAISAKEYTEDLGYYSSVIAGTTWNFTYNHSDSVVWYADVSFYEDGTTFYTEPANPGVYDTYGTWYAKGDSLTYNLYGDPYSTSYIHKSLINDSVMSGTYTFGTGQPLHNWEAVIE